MFKKTSLFRHLITMAAFSLLLVGCNEGDNGNNLAKDPYLSTDFSHGTYILSGGNMSDQTGKLTYISDKGLVLDSVYIKVNPGHKLGNVCHSMSFCGDKVYFLSQNGEKRNGGDGVLVVAELKTMRHVTAYLSSELALTTPTHITVMSDSKAYVRDSKGVNVTDLKGRKVTALIAGSAGANSAAMLLNGTNIYAGASTKLLIIDTKTDAVTKTVAMPGKVSNIIASRDGNLWVSAGANILKVSLTGAIIKQNSITGTSPIGFDAVGLCEATSGESLFFCGGSGWSATGVYRHNFTDGTTSLFVEPKTMVDNGAGADIYGQTAINPKTGIIYVPTHAGFGELYKTNCVSTYNTATANPTQAIDRLYNHTYFCSSIYFR